MKKGLYNPTLHYIRSASYVSPHANMARVNTTYPMSVENMAGSGYNKNSKKLRELYDDAKGIAIGARPNPEQNTKRFWGLYGQQANTTPFQSTNQMENSMRLNEDKLRYGNANRRISKSASIKKESYYNTFGGGYDPNVVVTPKKGRPFKGQSDSLPLVSKRAKNISKASREPDYITYLRAGPSNPQTERALENARNRITDFLGPFDRETKSNDTANSFLEDWSIKYGFVPKESRKINRPNQYGFIPPSEKKVNLSDKEYQNLFDVSAANFTSLDSNKQPSGTEYVYYGKFKPQTTPFSAAQKKKLLNEAALNYTGGNDFLNNESSLQYAYSPKVRADEKLPSQKPWDEAKTGLKQFLSHPAIIGGVQVPIAIGGLLKNPAIKGPVRYALGKVGAAVGGIDIAAAISSLIYANQAQDAEWKYKSQGKPTNVNYTMPDKSSYNMSSNDPREIYANLPKQISATYGDAANRKYGDFKQNAEYWTSQLPGGGYVNSLLNTSVLAGLKPIIGLLPEKTKNDINQYINNFVQTGVNTWDKNEVFDEFTESRNRPKYDPVFENNTLNAQQEIARFGRPYETRIQPSVLRNVAEGAVSAFFGAHNVGRGYNQDYSSNLPWYQQLPAYLDDLFLDQTSAKGMAQGPQTVVYGYTTGAEATPQVATESVLGGPQKEKVFRSPQLKATRVGRPFGEKPGQNMLPYSQVPITSKGFTPTRTQWIEGMNQLAEEDLYTSAMRELNKTPFGDYLPTAQPVSTQDEARQVLERTGDPRIPVLKPGYYPNVANDEYMYGVQLTPFNRITGEPNVENLSPYYVPESSKISQILASLFPNAKPNSNTAVTDANAFSGSSSNYGNPFGFYPTSVIKSLKKPTKSTQKTNQTRVAPDKKNKSITKSLSKNVKPVSTTSLRHSNKYMK